VSSMLSQVIARYARPATYQLLRPKNERSEQSRAATYQSISAEGCLLARSVSTEETSEASFRVRQPTYYSLPTLPTKICVSN
jgi:hypothetical protein